MTTTHDIKKGDKVRILIGEGDMSHYGMFSEMRHVKGEVGTVQEVCRERINVCHPTFTHGYNYKSSEVEKVEFRDKTCQFKVGDRVKILTGGAYGSNDSMLEKYGALGTVSEVIEKPHMPECGGFSILVKADGDTYGWTYAPFELEPAIVGKSADCVIVDDPVSKHIQSHDELVAENESLEKQIRKLEARVERKKEFQRKNVRKIAAWQVILEK